jgi:hypothetical protein
MSQVCIKCTKGIVHDDDVCPKHYAGSAKDMKATGAAKMLVDCLQIWKTSVMLQTS